MTQRKVSNPLALAVLSCLAERPMHPYEIASTLRERHIDESIRLNYGSLYSIIEALMKHGFIEAKERVKAGKRPERTVYDLSEAGALELNDWLAELLAVPAKEYTQFEAGLALVEHVPPEEATALLERRCDQLRLALTRARSVLEVTQGKQLPRLFVIDLEYRMMMREAELAWVLALIADIRTGQLDGIDHWRSFFESAEKLRP